MLEKIGRIAVGRPKAVLITASILMLAMVAVGVGAFGVLKSGGFDDTGSQSWKSQQAITAEFGGEANLILVVGARTGGIDSGAAAQAGQTLTRELTADRGVTGVVSYFSGHSPALRSTDGRDAMVLVRVLGDDNQVGKTTDRLLSGYVKDGPAVTVQAGGEAAVNHNVTTQVSKDLATAESIAIPLTLVLLILAFGSLVAALLPLAIGLVAILGTFAELAILGRLTDVSVFAINLTTALGLGLGIDYALLMVARFREYLAQGTSVPDAVHGTLRTAGRTIAFSALTVAAALAALLVFPFYFLRSFAYAGIGVVAIAAASALIIMPALLSVLGTRVNAGRLPWARHSTQSSAAPAWGRLASAVMKRPALMALPVVALLAFLATPLLGASFGTPDETVLPTSAPARQAADTLHNDFQGNQATAVQIITTGPADTSSVAAYAAKLSTLPGAVRVDSSAGSYAQGAALGLGPSDAGMANASAQHLTLFTAADGHSSAAEQLVRAARALPGPGGTSTLIGGDTARLIDSEHGITARLPYAIGWVVLTTFIVLFLFTGSVTQPLRALVLNTLGLSASIGTMVWIFQQGHFSGLLDFTARPMDTAMTVLLFCIAFGLSMDYEVFLTSRIKELHAQGADLRDSVSEGLARTGRIVSTAAGLLAVSFFAFGTASVSFLQFFGLGCGVAILIDALLIRGILVPAAMRLLGRSAWWAPGPLRRLHERFGVSEGAVAEVEAQPAELIGSARVTR
ncbi:MMPL family transporter [Catenulispora sp. NF23]|uniref:MMPL family transporter n=1 Tax=Catenulispora pinistramenti TaxID=2705254 RepID=A0ABS5L6R2_9ACTN|nr:MMPL family transporter [Catenulispora pinistramenti]MBS2538955.1 MMPL family transporter [Catenulispora pinistramenti]MBS2553879.1 MMPL family transporter [Catenulispora pinistramenti]